MLALLIERYPGMASGMGAPQIRLPTTRSIRPAIAVRYFAGAHAYGSQDIDHEYSADSGSTNACGAQW